MITIASLLDAGRWLTDPGQLLGALLSMPWVSLILAGIIAVGITVTPVWRARSATTGSAPVGVAPRYAPEHRTIGVAAIAVVVVFLVENLITGYALDLRDVVSWWRYATPVFAASVGVAALLLVIITSGRRAPELPVVSARRTWRSFSSPLGTAGAAVAVLALTTTTVLAGLASSNIDGGPYVFLEIDVPNESIDPLRPWFYGWAYGVPVLTCTVGLVIVAVAALHANAVRPFLRPETVAAEQRERRSVALGIARIVTAAALLALAGAWRFIADAGSVTSLTVLGDEGSDSYTAFWRYGELAAIGGGLAPLLEITAFVILLLATAQLAPHRIDPQPSDAVAPLTAREAAR